MQNSQPSAFFGVSQSIDILKRLINRSSMLSPVSYAVHDALSYFFPVPGAGAPQHGVPVAIQLTHHSQMPRQHSMVRASNLHLFGRV